MNEIIKNKTVIKRINPLTKEPITVVAGEVAELTDYSKLKGQVVPISPQLKEALKGRVVNVNKVQPK